MRHHSLVAGLVSLLAGCAASTPSGPAAPGGYPAGQWRSLTPEQIAPAIPANALLEPLGGRVRSIGTEEIVAEIALANASTAPGTNQITVAVDMVSPYTRSRKQAPATATYEIDPAQRLELLGTYFPDEVQAGAPQTRAVPGGAPPNSSPSTASCGRAARSRATARRSTSRSAAVTTSVSVDLVDTSPSASSRMRRAWSAATRTTSTAVASSSRGSAPSSATMSSLSTLRSGGSA